jgi:hypothetical protein
MGTYSSISRVFALEPSRAHEKHSYDMNYDDNYSAARQTRTDDPLVNSQLSFEAQYRASKLLYHAELERRTITANPRTK